MKPVPLASQPARSKALVTCLPSRPVAPVTRTVRVMVVDVIQELVEVRRIGGSFKINRSFVPNDIASRARFTSRLMASCHIHRVSRYLQQVEVFSLIMAAFLDVYPLSPSSTSPCSLRSPHLTRANPHPVLLLHGSPQGTLRNEKESLSRSLVSKNSSSGRSQTRAVMVIVFN